MSKVQTILMTFVQYLQERRWRQLVAIAAVVAAGLLTILIGCNRAPAFYKNDAAHPIANGEVRVLCYDTQNLGAVPAEGSDTAVSNTNIYTITTDSKGRFAAAQDAAGSQSNQWPDGCPFVLALAEAYTYQTGADKPNHGPAYVVYATNWTPGSETPQNIDQPVIVFDDADHRLVLFNVLVSIAWSARETYVQELKAGLSHASALLYDLTDGQMAFARPSIYLNGGHWDDADIRVLAANDYRPTAYVGGMVREMTPFWADGLNINARHHPGAIFLGRQWDARDAADGQWDSQIGYSTIVHEWGHYALFLHDEYLNKDHAPASCGCPYAPFELARTGTRCTAPNPGFSPMYYQYAFNGDESATEFWHITNLDTISCKETVQAFVHGQSDWETLGQWYRIQGVMADLPFTAAGLKIPAGNPLAGPEKSQLVYDLAASFVIQDQPAEAMPVADQTSLTIMNPADTAVANSMATDFPAQVYLLEGMADNGRAQRIIYQGLYPVNIPAQKAGQEQIVGVKNASDYLQIFVDQYTTPGNPGRRWVYSAPVGTVAGTGSTPVAAEVTADNWQPSLDITYGISGTALTTMTVTVTSTNPSLSSTGVIPTVELCVMDTAVGCPDDWHTPMTALPSQPGVWQAALAALGTDELPRYGIIRVHAAGVGDIIRWIQVAGVGPIHGDSDSPTRDGSIIVDTVKNIPLEPEDTIHECYRMIVMPAANYELLQTGLPFAGNYRIVGVPLEVDMVMTDAIATAGGGTAYECRHFKANEELPVPVVYTLFYDTAQLSGGASLRVLQYTPGESPDTAVHWTDVSPTDAAGLSLKYDAMGGTLNLNINGDSRIFSSFAALDGTTIGGVKVTDNGLGNGLGTLTFTGPINTFAIGGQELFVDDICLRLASTAAPAQNPPCIDFEDQPPGTQFVVGDVIPTEPAVAVEPFFFSNADQTNEGYAQVIETNDNACDCISGQMLLVNNVNLNFDLSSYFSPQTVPDQEYSGTEPEIAWLSTAPILHSGIFVLVERP